MKHMRQPEGSNLCGQTCVAMLIGEKNLDYVISDMRKRGKTTRKDLYQALVDYGLKPGEKLIRGYPATPDVTAIVRVKWKDINQTHWVVYQNAWVFDPALGEPATTMQYADILERHNGYVVSHFNVKGVKPS